MNVLKEKTHQDRGGGEGGCKRCPKKHGRRRRISEKGEKEESEAEKEFSKRARCELKFTSQTNCREKSYQKLQKEAKKRGITCQRQHLSIGRFI
jgi:hypothetical protein